MMSANLLQRQRAGSNEFCLEDLLRFLPALLFFNPMPSGSFGLDAVGPESSDLKTAVVEVQMTVI